MANFVNKTIFLAVSAGTVDFVVASAVAGGQTPAAAGAVDGQIYSYSAQLAGLTQWEYGAGVYTASTQTVARTTVLGNHFGTTAKVAFSSPPQVMLTPLAADLAASIIVSTTAPGNPQQGQVWFNPITQVTSLAQIPSYAWSSTLSAGSVVLSGADLIASRNDGSYPNIVASPLQAGAKSASILPSAQKYVFAITTFLDLSGNGSFGICDDGQTTGNGMFLGSTSSSIGYYIGTAGAAYFINNAIAASYVGSFPNGVYYVAIDPVGKLIWVKPAGGDWNGSAANNPATGVGGVAFPIAMNVSRTRIIAQLWNNTNNATIDPTASGLGTVTGFTSLSQIVLWQTLLAIPPVGNRAVNIKVDYGAIGDGVADDGASFQRFTKDYQGQKITLFIPPGHYVSGSNTLGLWNGIAELTIFGYGAIIDSGLDTGGGADAFTLANSALVQSCNTGDAQLALVNIADASKFNAGDWILLGALDIQGGGIPPNCHYAEYVQITSVSGVDIFLDNYLRGGPYKSTYPYYTNNASGVNEGGPATIWNMTQMLPNNRWDADVICNGVTFLNAKAMAFVRNLYYRDCKWPGINTSNCPNPVLHQYNTFDNCLIQGGPIEVDKNITQLRFTNCNLIGYYNALVFQSSSVQQLIIEGSQILILNGTPKNTYIKDSWVSTINPGPRANGVMESLYIENSYIRTMDFTQCGAGFGNVSNISGFTFSNGTFSTPNTGGTSFIPWAAPGAKCVFQETGSFYRAPPFFTILDVRSDAPGTPATGNILIDTTLASIPGWTQGTIPATVVVPTVMTGHVYPNVTIKNCRGSRNVMNWQRSDNPSHEGGPGFTYDQLMLTGNATASVSNLHVEGVLSKINITVLRAYTGANGAEALVCDQFWFFTPAFAGIVYTISVDVKTAGLRTWAAGSWTGSVGADSLPAISAGSWAFGYNGWHFDNSMVSDTLAQTPIVVVELFTDAGIIKYPLIDYKNVTLES